MGWFSAVSLTLNAYDAYDVPSDAVGLDHCFAGLIWRVDLEPGAAGARPRLGRPRHHGRRSGRGGPVAAAAGRQRRAPRREDRLPLLHLHRAAGVHACPDRSRHGSEVRHLAGDPLDPALVGPSSACWGREDGDVGRVMYVTTDGGTTAPPDGTLRNAALLRVELRGKAS